MVVERLKEILYRCWDFSLFITGEGSWRLRPIEVVMLDAVKKNLGHNISSLLETQLHQKFFIQRMNNSRVNTVIFYNKNEAYKIKDDQFQDLLLKVELIINKKKQHAHVTFFEGYISTIEFKKPKSFYHGKTIEVGDVKLGKSDMSHASAIDRTEHGKL